MFSNARKGAAAFVLAAATAAALLGGGSARAGTADTGSSTANVTVTGGVMSISATVTYTGWGPMTLTVGETDDVLGSKVAQASMPSQGIDGKWHLAVSGLKSGTTYWVRLDAAGRSLSGPNPVKTKTRNVAVDVTAIQVIDDGDGWPNGCGDFKFTDRTGVANFFRYYPVPQFEICVDSGQTTYVAPSLDGGWFGHWQKNVAEDRLREEFYAWDDDVSDAFGSYADCGWDIPLWLNPSCGDLGYGFTYLDIKAPGKRAFSVEARGYNVNGNSVDVIAHGTFTVAYS